MNPKHEVLFEEISGVGGDLGMITLNRPEVLNSLNQSMVIAIDEKLKSWKEASHIKAVVIRGASGKAFCAGGDLRVLYEGLKGQDPRVADFFRDEYQLNRRIFHFSKPYIALLDGITMGGGVGVSLHGSHRVATERLMFAMPETAIGFFPDVGGTYFLPRLPYGIGFYLGLTGARLNADDCVTLGITQQKVLHERLPELIQTLANSNFGEDKKQAVTDIIQTFQSGNETSRLFEKREMIQTCFSKPTVEAILKALRESSNAFCDETIRFIEKKSPTSLKISLRAMQESLSLDFDTCMQQEYRLTCRFLQGHDFAEGIRAAIVDKDQLPMWKPMSLDQVKISDIESYFHF